MDIRNHCAYNRTRECFLGLEVAEADIQYRHLDDLTASLTFKSGQGLWVVPFRGIPATRAGILLDLVYLDGECRVVEVAESFLTAREAHVNPQAASVLILPPHTIYSSQTQPGDQLVVCVAAEMERRLERLDDVTVSAEAVQGAAILREMPLWGGGPGLLELEDRTRKSEVAKAQPFHEMRLADPARRSYKPPKNWMERWWSPDPRTAPREPASSLAAYYWNGAAPQPHSVRDISSTGLYVVTEERWYPGTLVLMTLQRSDRSDEPEERSIYVHTRAVRWGNDGVGLQFVLDEPEDAGKLKTAVGSTANRKVLDRFLKYLWGNKG